MLQQVRVHTVKVPTRSCIAISLSTRPCLAKPISVTWPTSFEWNAWEHLTRASVPSLVPLGSDYVMGGYPERGIPLHPRWEINSRWKVVVKVVVAVVMRL